MHNAGDQLTAAGTGRSSRFIVAAACCRYDLMASDADELVSRIIEED
ncbi:hypothetical protein [Streptomyces sp. NPDC051173]